VVALALPFHWTTEFETKLLPLITNVNPALPDGTVAGEIVVTDGIGLTPVPVGAVTVKIAALDVPPPGAGLNTVTWALPSDAISESRITACNCVLLTKVVALALPFHWTTEFETKLLPLMINVNPELADGAVAGEIVMTEGTGLTLVP
jgi:hypothetical protein